MAKQIPIELFLEKARHFAVIDVRSPKEYAKGHIPGAFNLPLFSDNERAKVGLEYKQLGRAKAIETGLDMVGPKLSLFVKKVKEITSEKEVLVHCWRGGMRSSSIAWLLEQAGFTAWTLQKGYKAYRQHVLKIFEQTASPIILGGMTGSGKSDILRKLNEEGHQVMDLEGVANHKGSAFGHIGQAEQPSTEQFENNLAKIWQQFDLSRPIWLEDECMMIGKVGIPYTLYQQMRKAPLIKIKLDREIRAVRLVKEYGQFDDAILAAAIERISKRLGGQHVKSALEALEQQDYHTVALITLYYYDKAYEHGMSKRMPDNVYSVELPSDDPDANARIILDYLHTNQKTIWKSRKVSGSPSTAMEPAVAAK